METIISSSLIGLLLLGFLLLAWYDLSLLVRRPVRGLGTGLSRVWAVARTTMIESWAGRVWLLPLLWLIACVIIMSVVRPYDEADRFPIYIRVLLSGQEYLVLVMLWVLACVSLPRDRERKIVVTNASKPISRLELLLGKMTGFSVIAMLLLGFMGLASWGVLHIADYSIRRSAQKAYELAENDYRQKVGTKDAVPPPEDKRRLAEEGSLFAYNYITVPRNGMSIVGKVDITDKGAVRYIKGGSMEKVSYRFSPRLIAPAANILAPTGSLSRPFFQFQFPMEPYVNPAPPAVVINVSAVRVGKGLAPQSARIQEKSLYLNPQGIAWWQMEHPEDLFSVDPGPGKPVPAEDDLGEVEVTVSCATPGVFLKILEGGVSDPSQSNVVAVPFDGAPMQMLPQPHPVSRGFEKRDMQEVGGPDKKELRSFGFAPLEVGVFRFAGKDLRNVPIDSDGNFTLSMALDTDKQDNYGSETEAVIRAFNQDAQGDVYKSPKFSVIEKRITKITLPSRLLGAENPKGRGDLVIMITCQTPGHWIIMGDNSIRIDQPQSPFVLNLFKSEGIILCEAILLVVICVTCSVRLGWPVAMLASFTIAAFGFLAKFLAELPNSGGLATLGYVNYGEQSTSYRFLDRTVAGIWQTLNFIRSLLPDYTRYDALQFITELRNMPWASLGVNMLWTLLYIIPIVAVGYLLIRKQELG